MAYKPSNIANGVLQLNSSGKVASAQLDTTLAEINDINRGSLSSGDVLTFNGVNFVADAAPYSGRYTMTALGDGDFTSDSYSMTASQLTSKRAFFEVNKTSAGTVVLPAVSGLNPGDEVTIKRTGSQITIDGNSSEQIDGSNTYVLAAARELAHLVVNQAGTGWLLA